MIETHAHIYSDKFEKDRHDMLEKAFEQGIDQILMPNVDSESVDGMLELELRYPERCFASMGLHPCSVEKHFEKELYEVEHWLNQRSFAAVGEMGLDLYWDKTFFEHQKEAFRVQCALAKKHKLPIIVHTREAMEQTIELLTSEQDGTLTGVVHCFSGTLADAQRIIELGFYLGIGGVVTYPKGGLDAVLPHIGLERIVLETDSPYLAPVPHRGKRNEPTYLHFVAQKIADLNQVHKSEVERITTQNACQLFKALAKSS